MILAIPSEEKLLTAPVCPSFGRAPYFILYNVEEESHHFIDNDAVNAQGGAGIKAAQTIVDSGAGVLIVPRLGKNAADVLTDSNITLFKSLEKSLADNIIAYKENALGALENIHPGFHNHG